MRSLCVKILVVTTAVARPQATNFTVRREVVAAAAATLFRQRGFNGVGIDDIGAAVGLTGPAVFHYFPNKQAVLTETADGLLLRLEEALAASRSNPATVLHRVVTTALEAPDALAVSMRHLGYLDPRIRGPISARMQRVASGLCRLGGRDDSVHLRARAIGGALVALGLARKPVDVAPHVVADDMVKAILNAPLPARLVARTRPARDAVRVRAAHAFRYEAILAEAARLFHERGFNGVSLDDIGAAVGVTGSAVSRRFGSKEQLLAAAFARLGDQLGAALYKTLSSVDDPAAGVEEMLRCYAEVAAGSRRLMCLNLSETDRLPSADRLARRKRQRAYTEELALLVNEAQPKLSVGEARLRARVALIVISEVINSDDLARRQGLVDDLTTLTMAILQPSEVPAP